MTEPLFGLTFEVEDKGLFRRLAGLSDDLRNDLSPMFEAMEPAFHSRVVERFGAEGEGDWEPLSPGYAAWKAVNHPGKPLLQREGPLLDSLDDGTSTGSVREISGTEATFGTSVPYAIIHQKTGRPILDMDQKMQAALVPVASKWLRERVAEAAG